MKIRLRPQIEESRDSADRDSGIPRRRVARFLFAVAVLALLGGWLIVRSLHNRAVPEGAVVFKGARLSLIPGNGWKATDSGGFTLVRNICLPALEGQGLFKGGTIEVLASPNFPDDLRLMATNLIKGLEGEPSVMKSSLRVDDFTTESGLSGIHVGCRIRVRDQERQGEAIAHSYLVKNARGNCVRINYTTVPGHDLEAVHQMILKTLNPW